MSLTLEFIIKALTNVSVGSATPITSAVIDSREAGPDALFVALPGETADGHAFANDALKRGAVAALIDKELETSYPVLDLRSPHSFDAIPPTPICLRVDNALTALQESARQWYARWHALPDRRTVGITGSVGKSTIKEVIASVLSVRYSVHKNIGSFNNEIGVPLTVLGLREDHTRAVMEMGFYVLGEIALLTGIAPPDVGIVTNISRVHLERAGSIETIIQGKGELIESLPPAGRAILNADDPNVMTMTAISNSPLLTYGLNSTADVWADQVEGLGLDGITFQLHANNETRKVHLSMLGRHTVYPALGAAAVGVAEGLTLDEIAQGLESIKDAIRLKALTGPHGSLLLDDTYNASPVSMIAALNLLADLREKRHIAVLGDMRELGSYEDEGHTKVGQRAAEVADRLVTVGERGKIIARAAVHGGMTSDDVTVCDTHERAIEFLQSTIQSGDAVLVKGSRAVHMERIVAALASTDDRTPE